MVSLRQLREADPGAFDELADRWARLAGQLSAVAADIGTTGGLLDGWHGEAAAAARAHVGDVRSGYRTSAEYIELIPPALRELSDAIETARSTVDGVAGSVKYPLSLNEQTGTVVATHGGPGDTRTEEEKEQDRRTAAELTSTIQGALDDVREADQAATAALDKATPSAAVLDLEAVGGDNIVTPAEIPGDASPAEVTRWWDSLTPMEQESAVYTHGDVIGGMDGIPAEARDRANRIRFAEEYADLGARREHLEALGGNRTADQDREYGRLGETLRGMDAIHERLEREPSATRPASYLLDFSTEGNGRGIVATGNPDTADNVVTSVPGTGRTWPASAASWTEARWCSTRPTGGHAASTTPPSAGSATTPRRTSVRRPTNTTPRTRPRTCAASRTG